MNNSKSNPPELINHRRIIDEPIKKVDWLIEPLIAKGDKVLIYGAWGSFKTWALMHLALHLAAGVDWFGQFPIPQPKKVLYLDEEMAESAFRRRWVQLAEGAGLEGKDLPFNLYSQPGIVFNEKAPLQLLDDLERMDFCPDVIMVETLRRVLVGSENEAKEVAGFWRNVKPFLKEGRTLILSHHMSKPSPGFHKPVRDRASGSTDIMAGVDTAFAIEKQQSGLLKVEHVKSRAAEEVGAFTLKFECEGQDGPAQLTLASPPSNLTPNIDQVRTNELDPFFRDREDDTVKTGEVIEYFTKKGQPKRSTERKILEWEQAGHIEKVKRGHWRKPQRRNEP
jgi:hypothetical protein